MIVLGLDTATQATAVALRLADGSILEARDDPSAGAHPGHATRLLSMAGDLLGRAGLEWRDLQRIAAGVGPGTFTGLRVGLATARGLAQSLEIELVGVSSLQALAECAFATSEVDRVLAVIDARRGEVFAAAYVRGEQAMPVELTEPAPLAPQAVAGILQHAGATDAEPGSGWLALGDGAVRYREQFVAAGLELPDDGSPLHRVSAGAICRLGAAASASEEAVVPDYRRRPDAELALQGAPSAAESAR